MHALEGDSQDLLWPEDNRLPRILVESTMIRSVGYHPQEFILEMEFRGRYYQEIWHFYGVPHWVPLGLVSANSKGAFYLNSIKGRFQARTIDQEEHLFLTPGARQRTTQAGGGISGGVSHMWPWAWNDLPTKEEPVAQAHTGPGWQGTSDNRIWMGTDAGQAWMRQHWDTARNTLIAAGANPDEIPEAPCLPTVEVDGQLMKGTVLIRAELDPKFWKPLRA